MTDRERIDALERRLADLEAQLAGLPEAVATLDRAVAAALSHGNLIELVVRRLAQCLGLRITLRPARAGEPADAVIETERPAPGGLQ